MDLHSERLRSDLEFRKVIFPVRDQCLCAVEFSPGQFSSSVRSQFIRGLIELIVCEHVLNSLIFVLNGADWNWSSEQWCLCPRIVTLFHLTRVRYKRLPNDAFGLIR